MALWNIAGITRENGASTSTVRTGKTRDSLSLQGSGGGGHRDAICVVADFFPMDPETGERNPIKEGDRWGRPPHPEGAQFSCATIGRRLADMGFNKVLNWENCIKRPVELVWLVRAANQQLLRSTVA